MVRSITGFQRVSVRHLRLITAIAEVGSMVRAGDRLLVSTASEDEWLDNIVDLGWRLHLCSTPPFLLQAREDRRMREYTDLAFRGDHAAAGAVQEVAAAAVEA